MSKSYDLSLTVPAADVSTDIREYNIKATDAQMNELVNRFKIISLSQLNAMVQLSALKEHDGFLVKGHISAKLEQQCIVSLKPVSEDIDEPFELMLVAPDVAEKFDEDEVYLDPEAPDYDAFEGGKIEIGEIIAQTVSVMMDPYPRRGDAQLEDVANKVVTVNEELEKKPNPFAVLSKLNDES